MGIIIIHLLVVSCSFLLLRTIFLRTEERTPSRVELIFVGAVSWLFILSAGLWLLLPLFLTYLAISGNFGALQGAALVIIFSAIAFRLNEALDSATVFHFLRDSAFFHPIRPHTMHVQEELDKKRIRDIHRETSEKPFPTAGKQKRLLTEKEIVGYQQQMTAAKDRPIQSRRYAEEIEMLKSGGAVDLSDGWKVYTFDRASHDLYGGMSGLMLDPVTRTLRFKLDIPAASERALQSPIVVYQLKQDLYQLFQILNTDPWLAWYNETFDSLDSTCYGIEPDAFGQTQLYAFMRIIIARAELHQREGQFFNAADLDKICTLTFNNGKPLSSEQL